MLPRLVGTLDSPGDQHGSVVVISLLGQKGAEMLEFLGGAAAPAIGSTVRGHAVVEHDRIQQRDVYGVSYAGVRKDVRHYREQNEYVRVEIPAVELHHCVVHCDEHFQRVHLVAGVQKVSFPAACHLAEHALRLAVHALSQLERLHQHVHAGDSVSGIALRVSPDPVLDQVAVRAVYRLNEQCAETGLDITSLAGRESRGGEAD